MTTQVRYDNAPLKLAADGIILTLNKAGLPPPAGIEKIIRAVLGSGGAGVIPSIALADDINEIRKISIKDEGRWSDFVSQACLSSEVFFDCYEILSSLGGVLQNETLCHISDNISEIAIGLKTAGSFPLMISRISSLYHEKKSIDLAPSKEQFLCYISAAEASAAAVSNIALWYGGSDNQLYAITSTAANVCKAARMLCNILPDTKTHPKIACHFP